MSRCHQLPAIDVISSRLSPIAVFVCVVEQADLHIDISIMHMTRAAHFIIIVNNIELITNSNTAELNNLTADAALEVSKNCAKL